MTTCLEQQPAPTQEQRPPITAQWSSAWVDDGPVQPDPQCASQFALALKRAQLDQAAADPEAPVAEFSSAF